MTRPRNSPRPALATSPFKRPETITPSVSGLSVGDRVTVDRFGMGKVVLVCIEQEFVSVDFGDGVIRQIPAGMRGFSRL